MDSPLRPPPSTLSPGSTVWAYLRDSGGPAQDRSIEQQRGILTEYCQAHGFTLLRTFADVHKSGGSVAARDDFNEMVATSATESLRPRALLIWNFARFARDLDDSQIYKGILRKRGILIHSLTDPIPEGPYSNVIETLIHVADEQKKHEAALGAWRGLRYIVKQGAMPGTPPRGFKREPLTVISEGGVQRQAHRWVPDPELAPRVLQAFQMRAAGGSLHQINLATRLYGSLNSYATFFSNRLYTGILEFGTLVIENYCEPIVPLHLWQSVQKRQSRFAKKRHLQSDAPEHPRRQHSSFLLSGLIQCARCHAPLYGHVSPQRNGQISRAYRCTRGQRRRDCDLPSIPAYSVETAVIQKINQVLRQPEYILTLLEAGRREQSTQIETAAYQRKDLKHDLAKLLRQINNVTSAIAESGHNKSLLDRLSNLEDDSAALRQKLADLPRTSSPLPDPDPATVERKLTTLVGRLQTADPGERRQLLMTLIQSVVIDRITDRLYGTLKIHLPLDLSSPASTPPTPPPTDDYLPPPPSVPSSHHPVGAPPYTHSIPFETPVIRKPRSK